MTPESDYDLFSQEVWETVHDHASRSLARREFCPDGSTIESIRCVHFAEESDSAYGRQVWFFEAAGVDPVGRKHRLYGALDFAVEYGLLEPARAMLMDEPQHRQRFLESITRPVRSQVWAHPSTKIWVRLTLASVFILSSIWLLSLAALLQN